MRTTTVVKPTPPDNLPGIEGTENAEIGLRARGPRGTPRLLAALSVACLFAAATAPSALARTAFVANAGTDTVVPVDLGSGTALTPINVGDSPFGIAIARMAAPPMWPT